MSADRTMRQWLDEGFGETRRDFLRAMGFSAGAAWLSGCRVPVHEALPAVEAAEGVLPGVSSLFATTCAGCSAGCGLLVEVRDGRPIKIEGNPESPISRGGTCALGQATVLSLYDDHRLAGPMWRGRPTTWAEVDAEVSARLAEIAASGRAIVLLASERGGPSWRRLLGEWRVSYPSAREVIDSPFGTEVLRRATAESFGAAVVPRPRLDDVELLVGLESDFLGAGRSPVEHARAYAARRTHDGRRLRHVQIESALSLTGSNADRRLAVHPSEVGLVAVELLSAVAALAGVASPTISTAAPFAAFAADLAKELWARRGRSLVLADETEPELLAVVYRLNSLLGNVGVTLALDRASLPAEGREDGLPKLIDAMERGEVGALLVAAGSNPVYDHPLAERFLSALGRVSLTVSFADRPDETSAHLQALCPAPHFLESWRDAEPIAGCFQLSQPTLAPLFDARPAEESLLRWMGRSENALDWLRTAWASEIFPRQDRFTRFDELWNHALERGVFELETAPSSAVHGATALADQRADSDLNAAVEALQHRAHEAARERERGALEMRLVETVGLRGGRWANNPWLQELPDPVTKLTWGNALSVSPAFAASAGLADGDLVTCTLPEGPARELPVLLQPGLTAGTATVTVGFGRTNAGKVASGLGVNVFPWRPFEDGVARNLRSGLRIARTGRTIELARTQTHFSTEGREHARVLPLAALETLEKAAESDFPSLWPEREKPEHHWAMAIDLDACTGCSACTIACQAENNVAVVGVDEVRRGREMHWLRIDRYQIDDDGDATFVHQPMMCQHCDHAPCETVCPVLATVHSSDGLNQQVYNRCIGTRYCANNCPYKVRRFNWFRYANNDRFDYTQNGALARMVLNPDVVVRSRGVMEKCSMCVQRIQEGKFAARRDGQPLADGAIRTACQQACPTRAISFGDLKDPSSEVSRKQSDPRFYRALEEVGTRPGTGYLARVRATE